MYIKIKPHDALFFRDGKPFVAGEDTWANTSPLPNPSVLWGAICSMFLSNANSIATLENNLKIKKIYLYNEDNHRIYLPAPRDIFIDETGKCISYAKYVDNDDDHISSLDIPCYITADTNAKTEDNSQYFIDITALCNAYCNFQHSLALLPASKVVVPDHKIGITRADHSHSSEEGKLYRIDMQQFRKDWSFLIEIENNTFIIPHKEGFLKLGGESKTACYQMSEEEPAYIKEFRMDLEAMYKKKHQAASFKIYLETPAIFEKGVWKPDTGSDYTLVAAATGKPVNIGGFDIKNKRPKPMYRAVPAGTVYLFAVNNTGAAPGNNLSSLRNSIERSMQHEKGFGAFEILPL